MTATTDSLPKAYNNRQKKSIKRQLTRNIRRRIKNQIYKVISGANNVSTKSVLSYPRIKVELLVERSMEVELFRYLGYSKTGYAVCPNCGFSLEREYQQHCEVCGQLLGWNKFARNEVIVQRKFVLSKENRNVNFLCSPKSVQTQQHFLKWGDLKYDRLSYYSIKKTNSNQPSSTCEADQAGHECLINI